LRHICGSISFGTMVTMDANFLRQALKLPLEDVLARLGETCQEGQPIFAARLRTSLPFNAASHALNWLGMQRYRLCRLLWQDRRIAAFMRGQASYQVLELTLIVFDIIRTVVNEPTCAWAA